MKKIKCIEREGYITYYGTDKPVMVHETVQEKKKETRGVWFSTVENIDIHPCDSVKEYQEQLDEVIQTCKKYHLNTVVFQVRPGCDAFYSSNINPWSCYLSKTRTEDVYPGFDLFGYFVEKANEAGIDVHAWMNPYRVRGSKLDVLKLTKEEFLNQYLSPKNFARQYPECVIETTEHQLILDPASAKVQDYLVETVLEIAKKYPIKAIHIDDYFYPYSPIQDPDEEKKHQALHPELSLNDFRRENVNCMIKKIHDALNTLDHKVEFGISPFGIYRTHSSHFEEEHKTGGWEFGSHNHCSCFQCYEGLYADVYLWMENGWIDYVVPQDYFSLDSYQTKEDGRSLEIVKYADLVDWWSWAAKKTNVKLYIGQGIYRYSDHGNWGNPEEIINQLKVNDLYENVKGSIFFTYHDFVKEDKPSLVEARKLLLKAWTKDVKPY